MTSSFNCIATNRFYLETEHFKQLFKEQSYCNGFADMVSASSD